MVTRHILLEDHHSISLNTTQITLAFYLQRGSVFH
jgi:hypothetical protein